jgi:hypothetical protein
MVNICLGKDFYYRLQAGQKTHRRPVLKGFVLQTQIPAFNKFMAMSSLPYNKTSKPLAVRNNSRGNFSGRGINRGYRELLDGRLRGQIVTI